MSETSSRTVARIVWGGLRTGAYLVLAGIVLFVALTRTEVGRNQLRQEIQSAFNARFAGSLKIGTLRGTLLNDVQATDVRIRDDAGRLVASIDSLSGEPSWSRLLAAELSVSSLTLFHPHLHLHRRADNTWNVRHALQRTGPSSKGSPLDMSFLSVAVRNGQITTTRSGAAPSLVQDQWAFDYTQTTVDSISLDGSVQWTDNQRRIALDALQARVPSLNLALQSAEANVARQGQRWIVDPLSFRLGNTSVAATATIQPTPDNPNQPAVDVTLAPSRLDHDQLRRLVPRLPLRNTVSIEGRVGGTTDRFVVNRLAVAHNRSRLAVEGTTFGLPDSLNLDAQLLESRVHPEDIRSVWPDAPVDRLGKVGLLTVSGSLRGIVEWQGRSEPTFDLQSTLSASGTPGAVRGSLSVQRSSTHAPRYSGRVSMDSLDLAPVSGRKRLDSRLTGTVQFDGTGTTASTFDGTLNATFTDSRIGPRRLALADLQLTAQQKTVRGTVDLRQSSGGTLSLKGTIDAQGASPLYDLTATAENLDLADLLPALPSSRLNATVTADGQGQSWKTLTGSVRLAVDESVLGTANRTRSLPPHEITLTLRAPSSDQPRLQIGGTLASASIDGRPLAPALRTSGRLWKDALRHTVRTEWAKAARAGPRSSPPAPSGDSTRAALRDSIAALPLQLEGDLAVHRMDLLRRWWPNAPDRADQLRATTTLTIGADTLSASGILTAAHLRVGARRVDSLSGSYQFSTPYRASLSQVITAALSVQADTLQMGERVLLRPSATATIVKGSGGLAAQAERLGRTGPFRLASKMRLNDGLSLEIADLYAGVGDNAWTAQSSGTFHLYSDAVVVNALSLRSTRPEVDSEQRLRVHGTLSAQPADTLHVDMRDVLLYPLAELASLPHALGGRVNGDVAVTGGWTQPQVRSALSVDRLSFDRRVLGDLSVQTRLRAGSPALFVDATLTPGPDSLSQLRGPPLVPNGPRMIEGNRLDVQGRVRLPGLAPDSLAADQLDLTANVDRADLFFFEYIFEETLTDVRGYTTGTIQIGGRFTDPIFNAEMKVRKGRFALPKFGLRYGIDGPVTVDRRGIHLGKVSVTDDGGSATITGSILFNDYNYFSFDLSGELDEISIVDVENARDLAFYGTIRASGPVSLTGPLSDATLRSPAARTTPDSELYIPVSEGGVDNGTGFIVFADSTGQVPNLRDLTQRDNILSDRPSGEPTFLEGLGIDINVIAPEESTVHLVFDPVVGDVVTAVGSGRVQLQRQEGEFLVYGDFNVTDGSYLFTAGEVFVRRFNINEGTITWDGPPINAQLDLKADYRTRASPAGLPGFDESAGRIPVRVLLDIGGRVETPRVDLGLALVRDERNRLVGSQALDAILNQEDRTTEYATSVLLTNTFLLTTESFTGGSGSGNGTDNTSGDLNTAGQKLAFNSVSQLVASQLNRYLGAALPNVDLNFGVQGENPNDLDLIYGVALRLLNERLVIRGEGIYTGDDPSNRQAPGPQGEFVVEVRLTSRISVEAFYRRSGDDLTQGQTLTSSTGAGLSYQSEFSTWRELWNRLFGWLFSDEEESNEAPPSPPPSREPPPTDTTAAPVAERDCRPDSTSASSTPPEDSN